MLKSCPFCGGKAIEDDKTIGVGGGDYRYIFGVKCSDEHGYCVVQPSVYVEGESGYRHGDVRTNDAAKRLSRLAWSVRF